MVALHPAGWLAFLSVDEDLFHRVEVNDRGGLAPQVLEQQIGHHSLRPKTGRNLSEKLFENQNNRQQSQFSFQFKSRSSSVVDPDPYVFEPSGIQICHYLY
jgi:hypothetical protein